MADKKLLYRILPTMEMNGIEVYYSKINNSDLLIEKETYIEHGRKQRYTIDREFVILSKNNISELEKMFDE